MDASVCKSRNETVHALMALDAQHSASSHYKNWEPVTCQTRRAISHGHRRIFIKVNTHKAKNTCHMLNLQRKTQTKSPSRPIKGRIQLYSSSQPAAAVSSGTVIPSLQALAILRDLEAAWYLKPSHSGMVHDECLASHTAA